MIPMRISTETGKGPELLRTGPRAATRWVGSGAAGVGIVLEPDARLVLLEAPKPLQLGGDDPQCRAPALRGLSRR